MLGIRINTLEDAKTAYINSGVFEWNLGIGNETEFIELIYRSFDYVDNSDILADLYYQYLEA